METMAHRVLLVEDDERIRASMRLSLEDEGYEVEEAAQAKRRLSSRLKPLSRSLRLARRRHHAPGMDGFECCRELRKASAVPIIMVTARTDTHDVVAGLEAGADDYVTKPFEPKELAARIRALLRRARAGEPGLVQLEFGDLEILPEAGVVRRSGEEVHLTRTEFLLLCELAANAGKVLSREQLLERVWSYDYFGTGDSSTSTSGACAPRSRMTPVSRATCSRCVASDTSSLRSDEGRRCGDGPGFARDPGPPVACH